MNVCDPCIDRGVPDCDDQLPTISHVGRGPVGDSFVIEQDTDSTGVYLDGYKVDGTTGEKTKVWESGNLTGGKLTCEQSVVQYGALDAGIQLTFSYKQNGVNDWTIETPIIPVATTPAGSLITYPVQTHPAGSKLVLSIAPTAPTAAPGTTVLWFKPV